LKGFNTKDPNHVDDSAVFIRQSPNAAPARPHAPGRPEKLRLGDVLVQQRLISQEQLQQTLELQRQTGKKTGRLLIESGVITEELLANGLARQLRIPFVNLKTFPFRADVVKLLPESAARRFRRWCWRTRATPCWWRWRSAGPVCL
jgi:hypothetical protein